LDKMTDSTNKIPVTHIITGLETGGAEMMLYKLLKAVDYQRFPSQVISLTGIGEIGRLIQGIGIPVSALDMKSGRFRLSETKILERQILDGKPVIVQTWMYHSDLLGGWAAKKVGVNKIAWNIRNSTLDWRKSKVSTLITVGLCAILSNFIPKRIAVCTQAAAQFHKKIGYSTKKMKILPNGFDLSEFKPKPISENQLRRELNLTPDVLVVGLAARFDEQKDHPTFIESAKIILKEFPDVHFILCGEGITSENQIIMQEILTAGVTGNFHLLGRRTDMREFHTACTVAVSSSAYGESFSNVLGEAMACGIPCVSTRVGGAEEVLGETGRIVPPGNPEKLAEAILEILRKPEPERLEMGEQSRRRIVENFEISHVAESYMHFWEELSWKN
jgi:glycosyltransferase involved in cell wall biosynthesis